MTRHLLKLVWNRKRSNALIVVEILISFIVVFAVITFGIYFADNYSQPLGFDWKNVLVVSIDMQQDTDDFFTPEQIEAEKAVYRELAAMPEVAVSAGSHVPAFSGGTISGGWEVNGKTVELFFDEVTDDFADVMRLKVIDGRWFSAEDDAATFRPVVIDADTARAIWGNENPVGKVLEKGEKGRTESRVIGVVSEYKKNGELAGRSNFVFSRHKVGADKERPTRNIVLRLKSEATGGVEQQIIDRLQKVAPQWSFTVDGMDEMRDTSFRMRLTPLIFGAVVALFLMLMVALGLMGVLWQNVTQRRRELGLRRAIGAAGAAVRRQIVAELLIVTSLGLALAVAVVVQIPLTGFLPFITGRIYAMSMVTSLLLVYGLALACSLYPGWLATKIEPAEALHYE